MSVQIVKKRKFNLLISREQLMILKKNSNIVEVCKFKARSGYNFIQIQNKYKKWHSKSKIKLKTLNI